jgi:hypothetical protein
VSVRRAPLVALCGLAAVAPIGCTEDFLVVTDPDDAPGASTPTIEVLLDARDLPSWRDTSYTGFTIPSGASYQLVSERTDLRARTLGRFSTIPDSVFVDTARVAIDSFTSAYVRFRVDTARSVISEAGIEVALLSMARTFDADEATWTRARIGEPWTTPGGDLGEELGRDSLTAPADTLAEQPDSLVVALAVDVDSLLSSWRESEGEPGFALSLLGVDTEVRVNSIALVAGAVPEGVDTVVTIVRGADPSTFIFDPATPEVTTRLRQAGLPSARYYFDFSLPDSIGLAELRGAIINKAALEFRPAAAPDDPFALAGELGSQTVRLLADPFVFGEKTPIGGTLGAPALLDPDSLAAGTVVSYDITAFVAAWSAVSADSVPLLRVGIIPFPENRAFGYWEFYSVEDADGLRPAVRILFTPNPSFLLP